MQKKKNNRNDCSAYLLSKRKIFSQTTLLILILTLSLALSGCSSSGSKSKTSSKEIDGFVGGTTGLKVNLIQGAPPDVIQDRGLTPFSFVLAVQNIGEAKIGAGTQNPLIITRLTGIRPSDFGLSEQSASQRADFSLEGAMRNLDGTITPGEMSNFNFDNLLYKGQVLDSTALTFRNEICYDYESYATTKLCFKNDVVESKEDLSICALNSQRPVGNSGSPVHITSVEQRAVNKDTLRVSFKIENVGKGILFYRGDYSDNYRPCEFLDTNPDIHKLEAEIDSLSPNSYSFECQRLDERALNGGAKGSVKLSAGGPTTITCMITRTKQTESRVYEDLFNIKLRYRYGEFLEKTVLVQPQP